MNTDWINQLNPKLAALGMVCLLVLLIGVTSYEPTQPDYSSADGVLQIATESGDYIEYYGADVQIRPDGTAQVTGVMKVMPAGDMIHGISYNTPSSHKREDGTPQRHSYQHHEATLNGKTAETHTYNVDWAGSMMYMGRSDRRPLKPGLHEFKFKYQVSGLIDTIDQAQKIKEIRNWNLFGDFNPFPVKSSIITLRFPPDVPVKEVGFKGIVRHRDGSGIDAKSKINPVENTIVFWSPRSLRPYEGLVISAKWAG